MSCQLSRVVLLAAWQQLFTSSSTTTGSMLQRIWIHVRCTLIKTKKLQIQIRMFLGIPDPDPDPIIFLYGTGSFHQQEKKSKKTLDFYYFVTAFDFLSRKAG
jgi:hypothetical protein